MLRTLRACACSLLPHSSTPCRTLRAVVAPPQRHKAVPTARTQRARCHCTRFTPRAGAVAALVALTALLLCLSAVPLVAGDAAPGTSGAHDGGDALAERADAPPAPPPSPPRRTPVAALVDDLRSTVEHINGVQRARQRASYGAALQACKVALRTASAAIVDTANSSAPACGANSSSDSACGDILRELSDANEDIRRRDAIITEERGEFSRRIEEAEESAQDAHRQVRRLMEERGWHAPGDTDAAGEQAPTLNGSSLSSSSLHLFAPSSWWWWWWWWCTLAGIGGFAAGRTMSRGTTPRTAGNAATRTAKHADAAWYATQRHSHRHRGRHAWHRAPLQAVLQCVFVANIAFFALFSTLLLFVADADNKLFAAGGGGGGDDDDNAAAAASTERRVPGAGTSSGWRTLHSALVFAAMTYASLLIAAAFLAHRCAAYTDADANADSHTASASNGDAARPDRRGHPRRRRSHRQRKRRDALFVPRLVHIVVAASVAGHYAMHVHSHVAGAHTGFDAVRPAMPSTAVAPTSTRSVRAGDTAATAARPQHIMRAHFAVYVVVFALLAIDTRHHLAIVTDATAAASSPSASGTRANSAWQDSADTRLRHVARSRHRKQSDAETDESGAEWRAMPSHRADTGAGEFRESSRHLSLSPSSPPSPSSSFSSSSPRSPPSSLSLSSSSSSSSSSFSSSLLLPSPLHVDAETGEWNERATRRQGASAHGHRGDNDAVAPADDDTYHGDTYRADPLGPWRSADRGAPATAGYAPLPAPASPTQYDAYGDDGTGDAENRIDNDICGAHVDRAPGDETLRASDYKRQSADARDTHASHARLRARHASGGAPRDGESAAAFAPLLPPPPPPPQFGRNAGGRPQAMTQSTITTGMPQAGACPAPLRDVNACARGRHRDDDTPRARDMT